VPYSIEELDTSADELENNSELELNAPIDELEDISPEDKITLEELDPDEIPELEKSSPEEDELSPSVSELLFPLSLSHAPKIKATATIPRNAIHCFCFIFCSLP